MATESYVDKLWKGLQERKKGTPVRFIYDRNMPDEFLKIITKKLNLGEDDVVVASNRYHNFKDFMKFPKIGPKSFFIQQLEPIPHADIPLGKSILAAMKRISSCFPYNPFDHFIDLLRRPLSILLLHPSR